MTDEVLFLPWLRRGFAQGLGTPDPLGGAMPGAPEVAGWVEVEGVRAEHRAELVGPDAVTALAPGQIVRQEPRPDAGQVEPNYFPLVELRAPDLPWLLTPAGPATDPGRPLRPWLVLVVVREQDGVAVRSSPGAALPVLAVEPPADPAAELPDLADSWAWAHVQSLVPATGVEPAVLADTGEVTARLVCPRRLLPGAGWIAALVPAVEGGRLRGLGREVPDTAPTAPAWDLAALRADAGAALELPVYAHWRFSTGPGGDFEALCRRLKPDGGGAELGLHAMDVGSPGLVPATGRPVIVDMHGALLTPGATPRPWPAGHRDAFRPAVRALVDAGVHRTQWRPPRDGYVPARDDPVVAPPMYGSAPAALAELPVAGWAAALNLDPVHRAAAGLGAEVVRAGQEAFVAAAWNQAGDLRETAAVVAAARLATEVGRSWARRAGATTDADLLQLTARLHALLPDAAGTVRARLVAGAAPVGLVGPAYLRRTRPATTLARDWRAWQGRADTRLSARHVQTSLQASRADAPPRTKAALTFAVAGVPSGAQVADRALDALEVLGDGPLRPGLEPAVATRIAGLVRVARPLSGAGGLPRVRPAADGSGVAQADGGTASGGDVSDLADSVRAALDPAAAVRASAVARVPALDDLLPAGSVGPMHLTPVLDTALSENLSRLGASWMLPAVDLLRRNRVRLVAGNAEFVGAFLVGANHELGHELLWRGYPVNLRGTYFHRFWSYLDSERGDVDELRNWGGVGRVGRSLAQNVLGGGDLSTVIVVRGDLVRRYPSAHYYLQQAERDGEDLVPMADAVLGASFQGMLDRQTLFVGFDLDPEVAAGDPGWFVAIEEQAGAPRFGLDAERPGRFGGTPTSWDQLSWGIWRTARRSSTR